MLNIKSILAALLMAACTVSAHAADKVVVFSVEAAIINTDAAKKALSGLQASGEYAGLQAKAEGLIADMKKLRDEQQSKGMTWNAEQQAEHRKKVEFINADLELARRKLGAEEQAVLRKVADDMKGKVQQVLNEVIQSEGIAIVLPLRNDSVIYVDPTADITGKVTEKLNKM